MSPSLSGVAAGAAVRNSLGLKHLSYASVGGCQPRFAFRTVADACVTRVLADRHHGAPGAIPENVTYCRIAASRVGPTPGTLSKRARLANGTLAARQSTI